VQEVWKLLAPLLLKGSPDQWHCLGKLHAASLVVWMARCYAAVAAEMEEVDERVRLALHNQPRVSFLRAKRAHR
jgi:hypothetical protein